jgi:hopanoid-associated phosphorylase
MLLVSGMGPARAEPAARKMIQNGATALVSWGFAGGLLPGLAPGTILLPEKIYAGDESVFFTDPEWRESLCGVLGREVDLRGGAIAESPGVLASPAGKCVLWRRTGAAAVDMESGTLARIAGESGVPFLAFRAITDPADAGLPRSALSAADEFGRVRPVRLFLGLCRRPAELAGLARALRYVRAAEASLAGVALRGWRDLARPPALRGKALQTASIRGGGLS